MAKTKDSKKEKLLLSYANLRKKLKRDISLKDFTKHTTFTRDMLVHHWRSIGSLDKAARVKYPNKFIDVRIETIKNMYFFIMSCRIFFPLITSLTWHI